MTLMNTYRFFFTNSRARAVLANLSILLLSWTAPISPAIAEEKIPIEPIVPVIICNAHVFESSLTKKEIKDIFLGIKRKWTSGEEIILTVVYQSKAHDPFAFYSEKNILDSSPIGNTRCLWGKVAFLKHFQTKGRW